MPQTHAKPATPTDDEAATVEQWLDNLDPTAMKWHDGAPHRRIIAAHEALAAAENELRQAVAAARDAGYSWTLIGAALGISRQAAQQRFRER